jgi:hypothetical protein
LAAKRQARLNGGNIVPTRRSAIAIFPTRRITAGTLAAKLRTTLRQSEADAAGRREMHTIGKRDFLGGLGLGMAASRVFSIELI